MFTTPFTYDPLFALEKCKGRSQTIPSQETDLLDLVRRSQINAILPDIQKSQEYGEDEEFDDAFDVETMDLADYSENLDYIGRMRKKIEEAKIKASEALSAKKDVATSDVPSEVAESPKNLD